MISNDLKWNTHINNVCSKASYTLGFVRRNLQNCPIQTSRAAYLTLVRSSLECAAVVWDPYSVAEIEKLENVQRRGVRFISRDFRSRQTGCVTQMLKDQNLPSLQERRRNIRLALLYKVANGTPPGLPPDDYLTPVRNKRQIRARRFDDYVAKNVVQGHKLRHSRCFKTPAAAGDVYKNSFFVRTTCSLEFLTRGTSKSFYFRWL